MLSLLLQCQNALLCQLLTHIIPYYTIIDFGEIDMRIYLPQKVIIHRGRQAEVKIIFKGSLPKLKSITVLLYDFNEERKFSTFTFVVKVIFNLQSKDFLTSFINCY